MEEERVELLVAGRGLRFAGWLVDTLVVGLLGLAPLLVGITGWPRFLTFEVLAAVDAIVLVAWLGGNVGNLVVGTGGGGGEDARRCGVGRAAIRWAVLRIPLYVAGALGAWWFTGIWWIVVYGPILFTPLRQGLHDRAAGVVVINCRYGPERWSFATVFRRVAR
jgi:hypothetical protein